MTKQTYYPWLNWLDKLTAANPAARAELAELRDVETIQLRIPLQKNPKFAAALRGLLKAYNFSFPLTHCVLEVRKDEG